MKWKIIYSPESEQDIENIIIYITYSLYAPEAALKLARKITDSISKLEDFPLMYKLYEHEPQKSQGVRYFHVNNYIIIYLPDENTKTVNIIRIMYGGRDLKNCLT